MKARYKKEELYKMDAVDVYKMVLKGDPIKAFPPGFWQQPEAQSNIIKCIRYLIEEVLRYDDETLKLKNSARLYQRHKLSGMLQLCFKNSPIDAINMAYPGKFQPWEFKMSPIGFWEDINNGINATKWLIETKLKLSDEQLKEQLSADLFINNDLGGMLGKCFNSSPYSAINAAYPGKFQEWEFNNTPMGFWEDINNGINATKWLIETKLKLSDEQLKEQLSTDLFINNGLSGMLYHCFNASPYNAISAAYPGKFQVWEFNFVPGGFWQDKKNRIDAIKWLIETKLKLSDKQIKEQLSVQLFYDNNLGSMLHYCFDGSPYRAINTAYPGKFQEWEFSCVAKGFWEDINNGINATKWLIETKLKLSDKQIKKQVSVKLFYENGLGGMLQHCFDSSPYNAINATYPGRFQKWELNSTPKGFWKDRNNVINAIKWLIETKLKLSDKQIKEQLSADLFINNGLGGLLENHFNGSLYKAMDLAYPNKFKKSDFKNLRNSN